MTVKELRDNMPCAFRLHSEFSALEADEIEQIDLFDNGGYLSKVYDDSSRALAKPHLVFPGN
jgi:hypothetical protein